MYPDSSVVIIAGLFAGCTGVVESAGEMGVVIRLDRNQLERVAAPYAIVKVIAGMPLQSPLEAL